MGVGTSTNLQEARPDTINPSARLEPTDYHRGSRDGTPDSTDESKMTRSKTTKERIIVEKALPKPKEYGTLSMDEKKDALEQEKDQKRFRPDNEVQ